MVNVVTYSKHYRSTKEVTGYEEETKGAREGGGIQVK